MTLSTIPPRFNLLQPTLESLLAQRLPAANIRLYIPETYRRFPDWDGRLPDVPEGISIHRCAADLGPATKVLPAARDLRDADVDLLFCDDDKLYDPDWHARLKRESARHPGCVIVEAGENLPDIADSARAADRLPRARRWDRKPLFYRLKRILSLCTYKSPMYASSGYVDLLSGHGGVLLRPDWLDDAAWDIPEIIWTVDDPWLSGQFERRGIPIWLVAERPRMRGAACGSVDALHDLVEADHNRVMADLAAIDWLRRTYGIWQPAGQPTPPADWMTETMRELAKRST
ncbi:glycosyltransferase family 2 protein [Paracoccus caeni]|uniref:Glycosyltransferase family 2 protein n=1 Tax=Paracoccus caeni TaxID=657651 RepID=A0A934SJP7_9RHOB|nr:glycosyltransferase family 2 protein [Paracoccus caeni]